MWNSLKCEFDWGINEVVQLDLKVKFANKLMIFLVRQPVIFGSDILYFINITLSIELSLCLRVLYWLTSSRYKVLVFDKIANHQHTDTIFIYFISIARFKISRGSVRYDSFLIIRCGIVDK